MDVAGPTSARNHSKMAIWEKRRYFMSFFGAEAFMIFARTFTRGMTHAQVVRLHDVLNLQIIMCVCSTIIYKRFASLLKNRSQSMRDSVKSIVVLFIVLSHSCWIFFYVYLPDNSLISIFSFICTSIFLHISCFLLLSIVFEYLLSILKGHSRLPFYILSKEFHTMIAFGMAIALTISGLSVTRFSPVVRRINVVINSLPYSLDGFSIVLLTDLHIGPTVGRKRIEEIVSISNSLKADAVTVVGDLVDGFIPNIGRHAFPLANLESKYGTFFVTGNHEYYHGDVDRWLRFFKTRLNMTVLRNSHKKLAHRGNSYLCLAGVDDYFTERLHIPHHEMNAEKAVEGCDPDIPTVLLVHQPNGASKILESPVGGQIDLVLSGHTHGGQLYIFWIMAYLKNAYLHGLYRVKKSSAQIYVSPGVNYWGPPVKMKNLCEITFITLRSPEADF